MIATPGETTEAEMVDLTGYSLRDLRADKSPELLEVVDLVTRQVQRTRVNLGGSSPPGRAD
jgi:hypothetical protein